MITNTRLIEIRATGLACQRRVDLGSATHLEKDFAELFQLCLDNLPQKNIKSVGRQESHAKGIPHLNFLLGK